MPAPQSVIEISKLTYSVSGRTILDGIDLSIAGGEIFAGQRHHKGAHNELHDGVEGEKGRAEGHLGLGERLRQLVVLYSHQVSGANFILDL